jgi:DNA-binding LacI/PurR family transcriptional regulator
MHVPSTAERLRAYEDAMQSVGADPGDLLRTFPYLAPATTAEYRQMVRMVQDALHTMLSGPTPPTAVFCLRDHYAAAVVEATENMGIRIPEDLEVLAFIDRPRYLLRIPDGVRQIEQDLATIGKVAAARVMGRLRGETLAPEHILVPALASERRVVHAS